jgi:streptomycin 6-kinase
VRIDPGARERLTLRFGGGVATWFDELPDTLAELRALWSLELGEPIPRGSVSVVFRCRAADGRGAVLKISPDRARVAFEAAALRGWRTVHAPVVLALDEQRGALLLEAIEPGTPLVVTGRYPPLERVAELLESLHAGVAAPSYPSVVRRAAYLFEASAKLYERDAGLESVVDRALYERGRLRAARLATDRVPAVLLHGDLTPSNILDGGGERGLVAIDPAPCVGDAAFDAVDVILWQADDVATVEARSEQLGAAAGVDAERLLGWCVAFAAMVALERASQGAARGRLEALLELAARA